MKQFVADQWDIFKHQNWRIWGPIYAVSACIGFAIGAVIW